VRHLRQGGAEPPRPFDADLCHTDIRPGDGWDDEPPIQSPHLRWQDSQLCEHHLRGAAGAYAQLTRRTASFN
jgi:hypothetical protein